MKWNGKLMQGCVLIFGLVDSVEKQCSDKIDVIDVGGCPLKLYSLG